MLNWMCRRYALPGLTVLSVLALSLLGACQGVPATTSAPSPADATQAADKLVIYSGRSENLIGPLIDQIGRATGIAIEVRYGDTAEMAATILEEGSNSPADLFFAQDAGALGALAQAGRLSPLPTEILDKVDARFRGVDGAWVGVSGRARVLVYNTDMLAAADLPETAFQLTDPKWRSRVGWAPTNGSFQAFVTAMRVLNGDDATRQWLEGMLANDVQEYPNNASIVEAVGSGEIGVGLVNHYYLYRFLDEQGESFPARNFYFADGGADALINVAGVGIVDTGDARDASLKVVDYLLSDEAQQYFTDETVEYPLSGENVTINPLLVPLSDLNPPALDLSNLSDLEGTLRMLQETGALQ